MSAGKGGGDRFWGLLWGPLSGHCADPTYPPQNSQSSQTKAKRQAPFTLTIENDLISLTTRDASVKAILEELDGG